MLGKVLKCQFVLLVGDGFQPFVGGASRYIRRYLMEKARSMLLDGQSVSAVSDALGFEYPQHFTRMFKKEFGVAPSQVGEAV